MFQHQDKTFTHFHVYTHTHTHGHAHAHARARTGPCAGMKGMLYFGNYKSERWMLSLLYDTESFDKLVVHLHFDNHTYTNRTII